MRQFYSLTYANTEENLLTVERAELVGFDHTLLWEGGTLSAFPKDLALFASGTSTDSVRNQLSWHILSNRATRLITRVAKRDVQLLPAPLFDITTRMPISGYDVVVPLNRIGCLDRSKSAYEVDEFLPNRLVVLSAVIDESRVPHDVEAFCLDESPYGDLFLSQAVVNELTGKRLRGIALIRT